MRVRPTIVMQTNALFATFTHWSLYQRPVLNEKKHIAMFMHIPLAIEHRKGIEAYQMASQHTSSPSASHLLCLC